MGLLVFFEPRNRVRQDQSISLLTARRWFQKSLKIMTTQPPDPFIKGNRWFKGSPYCSAGYLGVGGTVRLIGHDLRLDNSKTLTTNLNPSFMYWFSAKQFRPLD